MAYLYPRGGLHFGGQRRAVQRALKGSPGLDGGSSGGVLRAVIHFE